MRRLFHGVLAGTALFLASPAILLALEIPQHPEGYVSDAAEALSAPARTRLEQVLKNFDEQTGNQVLVATFFRLDGEALEPYSIRLAEAWKPGQKGKDNGAILVVFTEDRKIRIEVGYGLEGVLTDALCSRIIGDDIAPRFRAGDYDGGIEAGISAILSAIRGEAPPVPDAGPASQRSLGFPAAVLWFLFLVGLVRVLVSVAAGQSSELSGRGYSRGFGGWGFGGFGGGGFGGGGFGGGGFSGGGGFGGGGASGSW